MRLKDMLSSVDIYLNQEQLDKLETYTSVLEEWNSRINLLANIDINFDILHLYDSLIVLKYLKFEKGKNIIDIGSGGGLPGIPLAIALPDKTIYCLDSSKKKVNVLREIKNRVGIENIELICDNAENIGHDNRYREFFDYATVRALASFSVINEYAIPLLKVGGIFIAFKGPKVKEEVDNSSISLGELNSRVVEKIDFKLPFLDHQRSLVVVEKTGKTKDKYPRKVGKPRRAPL